MSTSPIVRAVDIGYGNTKFILDDGRQCGMFRSLARPVFHSSMGDELVLKRNTIRVLVDNQEYEVGPGMESMRGIPELHQDYIETPQYRALFYGALHCMKQSRINLLVTGLPVHLHKANAKRLKEILTGKHEIQKGEFVKIDRVAVVAQPLGGLVHQAFSTDFVSGDNQRSVLLVDPGYFTFDWMVSRGLKQDLDLSGSVTCGVSAYLSRIEKAICADLKLHDPGLLQDIDDGLRTGTFKRFGKPIDLTPYKSFGLPVLQEALRCMRNNVDSGGDIEEIFIVGGGASHFEPVIRDYYSQHRVTVVSDSIFANVRGFMYIGQTHAAARDAA